MRDKRGPGLFVDLKCVSSMTECCVSGPCDEDSRLEEGHAMSQERAEKSPAPVKYMMGFGIYLKDSGKLLKDVI